MKVALFRSLRGQASMERYARALAAALNAPGFDCRPELFPPPGFPAGPFHWRKYVSYQTAARRWGRASDVCHVVDHGYGHLIWSLPRGRSVVTVHDMGPLWKGRSRFAGREGGPGASAAFWYSVQAIKRAARIAAVSESARSDLLEYTDWPPERVTVIHSGVDGRFRPPADALAQEAALRKLGLAGRRFVLHVGASSARKNLAVVLRALPKLDPELSLIKAGAPLEPPEKELAARLGLGGRVSEIGPVDDGLLPALYAAAEALVFPSLYEGFGWPPLEAMACGTPAAISGIPALREIAGPGAAVVENPDDPEEFAAAVRRCLRGSAGREELVARGRARAAEFTWEKTARAYAGLYREVLAEAGR
jgi:glycosyltransferase involved in cell wall biosynthesis